MNKWMKIAKVLWTIFSVIKEVKDQEKVDKVVGAVKDVVKVEGKAND